MLSNDYIKPTILHITKVLSFISTECFIKGIKVPTLIDSCSTDNFISTSTASRLSLHIAECDQEVNLASADFKAKVIGVCFVNMQV